jgi:ankyrin repeat protein
MESHKIYDVADMLFYISSLLPFGILIKMRKISRKFKNVTESVLWRIHNLNWTLLQSEYTMIHDKNLLVRNNKKKIFEFAIEHGYDNIIHVLLKLNVDPSADNNFAIGLASANGHIAVVQLLLNDKRVDPSADDNYAIRRASANGHIAVVQILLNDKRVDPSTHRNHAIQLASAKGNTAVVQLLLNDKRVDPSAHRNFAIQLASANGHTAVVRLLLNDKRVDPSAGNNYAIRCASNNGQIDVVQLLKADKRVAYTYTQ